MKHQKIIKVLKTSQQNNSVKTVRSNTVKNKNDKQISKEIPKERYISLEER